jgi:hypothetical protein
MNKREKLLFWFGFMVGRQMTIGGGEEISGEIATCLAEAWQIKPFDDEGREIFAETGQEVEHATVSIHPEWGDFIAKL